MFPERALADIILKVAPNIYQKYVIKRSKGKALLYIRIKRGCMAYYAAINFLQESGEGS